MRPAASDRAGVLPSNVATDAAPHDEVQPEDDMLGDVAFAVGLLAVLTTCLTIVGYQFGGPLPRLGFWRAFAPPLLLPLAILLGVLLGPGTPVGGHRASRRRVGLVAAGLGIFACALLALNGPSVLLLGY